MPYIPHPLPSQLRGFNVRGVNEIHHVHHVVAVPALAIPPRCTSITTSQPNANTLSPEDIDEIVSAACSGLDHNESSSPDSISIPGQNSTEPRSATSSAAEQSLPNDTTQTEPPPNSNSNSNDNDNEAVERRGQIGDAVAVAAVETVVDFAITAGIEAAKKGTKNWWRRHKEKKEREREKEEEREEEERRKGMEMEQAQGKEGGS